MSATGKYVSKTSSYLYFLTVIPIRSFLPFQFLFGVIRIDLTLRNFVETILISNLRYKFASIISLKSLILLVTKVPFSLVSLSNISLGERCGYSSITSMIKSKKGSTLPSNGLFSFIDNIRRPSPFCRKDRD
jgi:hypothetical protein